MNIDKDTLLNLLHSSGHHDQADQAAAQLPDQVDTDQHAGVLSKLGVDVPELIAKFGGGNLAGGLGRLFGGHAQTTGNAAVDPEGEALDPTEDAPAGTNPAGGLGDLLGGPGR